ncbi:MAG: hypothetical protein ACI8TQ_002772 [Planctomycetota bacterium]|jgi:uncharacterized protein YbaR (Trm112 family)/SAM-dependent methyltransferase
MGIYTRMTRAWLDQRYRQTDEAGVYLAHQPIYGLAHPASEGFHLTRMARTFQILKVLNRLSFENVLDVGASEGYLGSLVRDLFGAEVLVSDLSTEAGHRANELFGLEGVAFDCARFPFRDDAFDLVICSEVIEHVEFPVDVMLELERVSGKALVLTTEEVTGDEAELIEHANNRRSMPHAERNLFHIDNMKLLYGADCECRSEYCGSPPADSVSLDEAKAWIQSATDVDHWDPNGLGVVAMALFNGAQKCDPRLPEEQLLEAVLKVAREPEPIGAPGAVTIATDKRDSFREMMSCPVCSGRLRFAETDSEPITCANCSREYTIFGGVPALYDESAPDPDPMDLESHLWVENDDAEKISAIMELYDRLEIPPANKDLSWNFEVAGTKDAWMPCAEMALREENGNGSAWLSKGDDPWIVGPLFELPESEAIAITIDMRIHNPDFPVDAGVGQIYWMGMGDLAFEESRSIQFSVVNDGEYHEYQVMLSEHDQWPASGGLWLRVDPVNGPAELDLRTIKLSVASSGGSEGGS